MKMFNAYLYLLSPLHTGGTSQEGNLVGIAKESHTDLPYLPSSTIRGRLRADTKENQKFLWGNTIEDITSGSAENLTQGALWVGDAGILYFPISSLSHGVVWVTSPFLLRRWIRLTNNNLTLPEVGSFSRGNSDNLYLRDTIFKSNELKEWDEWSYYIPQGSEETQNISQALVLSEHDCKVLIESSLWRQVRVNLNDKKEADAFRYEEAIPPETLMFFPWGTTTTLKDDEVKTACNGFQSLLEDNIKQIGGQESLGRGFVEIWTDYPEEQLVNTQNNQEEAAIC
ncbi:MAG: type III-B CRISPR module RAMP protein Cmr4 [Iphinoe sp. HA4291-MV1]|jgi:CRISPR-associated protein Cmr4|nr:type III-B CRISPR module RAMP protein Cmr4 [Iphinoe sp. HA4291-MV1]